jgi:hypothetical protein
MTCKKVRKSLPLLAGGDLSARKERRLRAHIGLCPDCRRELEELRAAIARVKAAAREESAGEWRDAEWKALMVRATAQKADRGRSAPFEPRPRWALASGLAAVVLLAVLAFIFRDSIFKSQGTGAGQGTVVVKKEELKGRPEQPPPSKPAGKKGKSVPVIQPEYLANKVGKRAPEQKTPAKGVAGQDVLSVTMVSKESGLQVVWFFNRNFEWKGDQK